MQISVLNEGKYKFSLSRLKTRLRVVWGKKYPRRRMRDTCAKSVFIDSFLSFWLKLETDSLIAGSVEKLL